MNQASHPDLPGKYIVISILLIASLLIGLGSYAMSQRHQEQIFHYMVEAGATEGYDAIYDFNKNYLMDAQGQPVLHFTALGGTPESEWGGGSQATLLSEYHPLPAGIHVRWFSVAENKFYEGEYLFDREQLNRLMSYQVRDLFWRDTSAFNHFFSFDVNLVLGGLATVWISSAGERYLLAQFYVSEVQDNDWEGFIQIHRRRSPPSREEFVESIFADPDSLMSTKTKQEIAEGRLPVDGAPWKRLMQKFPWKLVGDENFTMQDYFAFYMNGEQYFTYTDPAKGFIQDRTVQPVPYRFSFYMADNTPEKKLHRINMYLKKDELLQQFEAMNKIEPANNPFELQVVVQPDFKKIFVYLVKGEHRIKLEMERAALTDLYSNQ